MPIYGLLDSKVESKALIGSRGDFPNGHATNGQHLVHPLIWHYQVPVLECTKGLAEARRFLHKETEKIGC